MADNGNYTVFMLFYAKMLWEFLEVKSCALSQ